MEHSCPRTRARPGGRRTGRARPGQPDGGLEGSCELGPAVRLRQQRVPPSAPSHWRTTAATVTEGSSLQTPPCLQQPRPATALPAAWRHLGGSPTQPLILTRTLRPDNPPARSLPGRLASTAFTRRARPAGSSSHRLINTSGAPPGLGGLAGGQETSGSSLCPQGGAHPALPRPQAHLPIPRPSPGAGSGGLARAWRKASVTQCYFIGGSR